MIPLTLIACTFAVFPSPASSIDRVAVGTWQLAGATFACAHDFRKQLDKKGQYPDFVAGFNHEIQKEKTGFVIWLKPDHTLVQHAMGKQTTGKWQPSGNAVKMVLSNGKPLPTFVLSRDHSHATEKVALGKMGTATFTFMRA